MRELNWKEKLLKFLGLDDSIHIDFDINIKKLAKDLGEYQVIEEMVCNYFAQRFATQRDYILLGLKEPDMELK